MAEIKYTNAHLPAYWFLYGTAGGQGRAGLCQDGSRDRHEHDIDHIVCRPSVR